MCVLKSNNLGQATLEHDTFFSLSLIIFLQIIIWIPAELSINAAWNLKCLFTPCLFKALSFKLSPNQIACFSSLAPFHSLTFFKSTNWLICFHTHSSPWVMFFIFLLQPPLLFYLSNPVLVHIKAPCIYFFFPVRGINCSPGTFLFLGMNKTWG